MTRFDVDRRLHHCFLLRRRCHCVIAFVSVLSSVCFSSPRFWDPVRCYRHDDDVDDDNGDGDGDDDDDDHDHDHDHNTSNNNHDFVTWPQLPHP